MKRRSAFRFVVIAGAVLFFLAGLGAWQSNFTIRSDVRLVVLDVSVKDPAGGFVSGLERENFTILEDGHRQPITVFANEDLPVTVGILVDESLSMRPKRADVLQAAETFIEASNPKDEIFVLNFNDRVTRGLPDRIPFSDNIVQLRSALHRGLPQGKTALNDAVVAGVKQLEMGRRDKKALVVISDGGDNASRHNRGDMLNAVESSTATIYTVGLFEPDDPDRDPGVLNKLARISGGEAFLPQNPAGMLPVCRRIAQDIRTRYTIGYLPQADHGKSKVRRIQVRVSAPDHKKLIARTRSSYRYEEENQEKE